MYLSLCNSMQTCGKLQCEDAMCNYFATKIANFSDIKVVFTYCTNLTHRQVLIYKYKFCMSFIMEKCGKFRKV